MGLTLRVGVLTEENPFVPSRDDSIRWRAEELEEVAESVRRRYGIDWAEQQMPWGTRPYWCRLSDQECQPAMDFFVAQYGRVADFCEAAEAVYTVLCYATSAARLDRYRYDAAPYGYAVPVGFRGFPFNVGPFGDAFVVSAFQVVEECERLGEVGGSVDVDAARFCSVLLDVARHSLRTGCAVVFAG